jgi:hypothetical protein
MERAEPQTILAKDGLPTENMKFCGGAQEMMAIIQGNKPVAATDFDRGYKPSATFIGFVIENKEEKMVEHFCRQYTYEDVYRASKKVRLLRYKYMKGGYYYFLEKNTLYAYLLYLFWDEKQIVQLIRYGLTDDIVNILIGLLLGYKKKDICAWFLMALENQYKLIQFSNRDTRDQKAKSKKLLKKQEEILQQFEISYAAALKKFAEMKREVKVPAEWKAKCEPLPAPSSRGQTRKKKSQ